MWPRDAHIGQFVIGLKDLMFKGETTLTKGKVYQIADITLVNGHVYLLLEEISIVWTHYSLLKPVQNSDIDVFRRMLKNVPNSENVVRDGYAQGERKTNTRHRFRVDN